MATTTGSSASPPPAARRKRRRLLLAALLLGGLAFIAFLGWQAWRRYSAPTPPEVALAGADPAVADAVNAALTAVRNEPYAVEPWAHLGRILRATDFLPEAAACFARAEVLAPTDPRWPYLQGEAFLRLGNPEAALPPLRRAALRADSNGETLLAPRLRLAEALLAADQGPEAESLLRRAQEVEPDHPCVALDFALLAYARDDLERSRELLQRCQHSPLTRKKACTQLAVVQQRLRQEAAAAQASRQAAALPPDQHWSDPWVLECLRLAPGRPGRFRYVEQLEGQGRLPEAVHELRALLADAPDFRVAVGLGKDLLTLGDFAGAEAALRTATQLAPSNAQAYYYLSKLCWSRAEQLWERQAGQAEALALYGAAADWARLAIKHKPDLALAHMLLGLCLERLGQPAEALRALRVAVACGPELPDPALHLGEALAAAGQPAEARKHLEHALSLARPDDARPRAALERLGVLRKKGS
jgi:tetratricopeptide (TPR) repeat protein